MTDSQPRQPPVSAAPQRRPPRKPVAQRTFHWLVAIVLGIHAVLAYTQSILAGAYLSGSLDAMDVHGAIGSGLTVLVLLQAIVCLLFWFPGRGPWWPLVASVVLFLAEGLQVGMGYARTLGLHIPLGVALIMAITAMFVWSLRWRPTARTAD